VQDESSHGIFNSSGFAVASTADGVPRLSTLQNRSCPTAIWNDKARKGFLHHPVKLPDKSLFTLKKIQKLKA
jgi:hypothetical protein